MPRERIVTERAEDDFDDIEDDSEGRFGKLQTIRYMELIAVAFETVFTEPFHLLSHSKDELAAGLRSFHVRHARKRARASHIVYYLVTDKAVSIVRILHEAMDPNRHPVIE